VITVAGELVFRAEERTRSREIGFAVIRDGKWFATSLVKPGPRESVGHESYDEAEAYVVREYARVAAAAAEKQEQGAQ
jgi:hypothetical protein